jgi:hypothetical protein
MKTIDTLICGAVTLGLLTIAASVIGGTVGDALLLVILPMTVLLVSHLSPSLGRPLGE